MFFNRVNKRLSELTDEEVSGGHTAMYSLLCDYQNSDVTSIYSCSMCRRFFNCKKCPWLVIKNKKCFKKYARIPILRLNKIPYFVDVRVLELKEWIDIYEKELNKRLVLKLQGFLEK